MANVPSVIVMSDLRPSFGSAMNVRSATIRTNASSAAAKASVTPSTALSVQGSRKTVMGAPKSSTLALPGRISSTRKRISEIIDSLSSHVHQLTAHAVFQATSRTCYAGDLLRKQSTRKNCPSQLARHHVQCNNVATPTSRAF